MDYIENQSNQDDLAQWSSIAYHHIHDSREQIVFIKSGSSGLAQQLKKKRETLKPICVF